MASMADLGFRTVVMMILTSSFLAAVCQFPTLVQTKISQQVLDGRLNSFDEIISLKG